MVHTSLRARSSGRDARVNLGQVVESGAGVGGEDGPSVGVCGGRDHQVVRTSTLSLGVGVSQQLCVMLGDVAVIVDDGHDGEDVGEECTLGGLAIGGRAMHPGEVFGDHRGRNGGIRRVRDGDDSAGGVDPYGVSRISRSSVDVLIGIGGGGGVVEAVEKRGVEQVGAGPPVQDLVERCTGFRRRRRHGGDTAPGASNHDGFAVFDGVEDRREVFWRLPMRSSPSWNHVI